MEMQPMLLCSRLFREYKTPYCTMQYSILPYDSALKKTSLFFFYFILFSCKNRRLAEETGVGVVNVYHGR